MDLAFIITILHIVTIGVVAFILVRILRRVMNTFEEQKKVKRCARVIDYIFDVEKAKSAVERVLVEHHKLVMDPNRRREIRFIARHKEWTTESESLFLSRILPMKNSSIGDQSTCQEGTAERGHTATDSSVPAEGVLRQGKLTRVHFGRTS